MEKKDVIAIAEGLKQIEDGVEKIQRVMREQNIKSMWSLLLDYLNFLCKRLCLAPTPAKAFC